MKSIEYSDRIFLSEGKYEVVRFLLLILNEDSVLS